jgi:hypothetical protein
MPELAPEWAQSLMVSIQQLSTRMTEIEKAAFVSRRSRPERSRSQAPSITTRSEKKLNQLIDDVHTIRLAQSQQQKDMLIRANTRNAVLRQFPLDDYERAPNFINKF